mgnify:CR=1 FL=1
MQLVGVYLVFTTLIVPALMQGRGIFREIVRKQVPVVEQAPEHLQPGGTLVCEIGDGQRLLLSEEQDLVYRDPASAMLPAPVAAPVPAAAWADS